MSDVLDALRERYPGYKDVPDDQLTVALGEKYPVYLKQSRELKADWDRIKFPEETGEGAIPGVGAMDTPDIRPPKAPGPVGELRVPTAMESFRRGPVARTFLGPPAIEREGMIEKPVLPQDIAVALLESTAIPKPIADLTRRVSQPVIDLLPHEVAGVVEGAREFGLNLPIGAGAVSLGKKAGLVIGGLFTGQYAFSLPEQLDQFNAARKAGDTKSAYSIATQAFLNGTLIGAGALYEGFKPREVLAPETTAAVKETTGAELKMPAGARPPLGESSFKVETVAPETAAVSAEQMTAEATATAVEEPKPTPTAPEPRPMFTEEAPRPATPVQPEPPKIEELPPKPPEEPPAAPPAEPVPAPKVETPPATTQTVPPRVRKAIAAQKQKAAERPEDIIDYILGHYGKIRPKTAAKPGSEGFYTSDYNQARITGGGKSLFDKSGASPDEIVDNLRRKGVFAQDATVDDLWTAVLKASESRRAYHLGETPEQKQAEFWKNQDKLRKSGKQLRVNVGDLALGDKFTMGGEQFEITDIDPETGEVTVKDGRKFGSQTLPDGHELPVDPGSLEIVQRGDWEAPAEKPPMKSAEPGFALEKPESVEEQKVRLAVEQQAALKKAEQEAMAAAQAKPLEGTTGDLGQMDMLGGGDLFAQKSQGAKAAVVPGLQEATAIAQGIDANNVGSLLEAFRHAHKAGYSGNEAMKAAWSLYAASSEKPAIKSYRDFKKAAVVMEEPMQAVHQALDIAKPKGPGWEGASMGGATPAAMAPRMGSTIGIKNASLDIQREKRGLAPLIAPLRQSFKEWWEKAMARIDDDPDIQDRLIVELEAGQKAGKVRVLDPVEVAMMEQRIADLTNEYDKAIDDGIQAKADGRIDDIATATLRADEWTKAIARIENLKRGRDSGFGSEAGRSLVALRMMMNRDYTLAGLERQLRATRGFEPITADERAELTTLAEEYKAKAETEHKAREGAEARAAEADSKRAMAELQAEKARIKSVSDYVIKIAEKIVARLDSEADLARNRLKGKLFSLSPDVLYDLSVIGASHISHIGLDIAKWSAKMIEEFGDQINPHLQTIWLAAQKRVHEVADTHLKRKKVPTDKHDQVKQQVTKTAPTIDDVKDKIAAKMEKHESASLTPQVKKLAEMLWDQGIRTHDKMIDALHGILKEFIPDISRQETMDALSGRGRFWQASQDATKKGVRDISAQSRLISHQMDVVAGKPLPRTGYQPDKMSDAARRELQKLEDLKRQYGVKVTDPSSQLASVLTARKTYLRNMMADMQLAMKNKQRMARGQSQVQPDAELTAMRTKYEAVKAEYDAMFPRAPKKPPTREQILAAAHKSVDREIAQLESDLDAGVLKRAKKAGQQISEPELDVKRAWLQALREHRQELRDVANPKKSPQEIALQSLKTRMANEKARLLEGLRTGEFPERSRNPVLMDKEATTAKAELQRIRRQVSDYLARNEMAARPRIEKLMDFLAGLRRFSVLSGIKTLGKLAAYSATKAASMVATETVGGVYSKVPILDKIAQAAPSEGGFAPSAMSKAFASAMTQGMLDAWRTWKTGASELKELYGERRYSYGEPRYGNQQWLQFNGLLHEIEKSPLRRGAFELSLAKRIEHARRNKVDVTDEGVRTAMALDAYRDSNRALLLEDNKAATAIRAGWALLESKHKSTGKASLIGKAAATAGRIELPILTVPLNFAKQTFEAVLGVPLGVTRAWWKGLDYLKDHPAEADAVFRNLKNGSVGGAIALYAFFDGYYQQNTFGGYWQPGERRGEGDAMPGTIRVFDFNIPSFLLHNPFVEAGMLANTVGRLMSPERRKPEPLPAAVAASMLGLMEHSPLGSEATEFSRMATGYNKMEALNRHLAGYLSPQLLKNIAEWTDSEVRRKPTGLIENLEMGVPGLRQNVPTP